MANIPVEKKSGGGWLPWLLGILALLALVWLAAELFDDEPDADEIAGAEDNVGVIDDVEIGDDDDMDAAGLGYTVGTAVSLDEVRVDRVIGDRTFTISSTDGALDVPSLVVLDEQPTTPSEPGVEGRVDINPGQLVSINGTVQEMDGDPATVLGITQVEADAVNAGQMFVRATEVDILEAELDNVEVD